MKKVLTYIFVTVVLIIIILILLGRALKSNYEEDLIETAQTEFDKDKPLESVLSNKKAISELSKFLIEHSKEIVNFNQHENFISLKTGKNSYTQYRKNGECFSFSIVDPWFISEYFPDSVIEELKQKISEIETENVSGGVLCLENHYGSKNLEKGSVFFHIDIKNQHKRNKKIIRTHEIGLNRRDDYKKLLIDNIESELEKNYEIDDELRYYIRILPNYGM